MAEPTDIPAEIAILPDVDAWTRAVAQRFERTAGQAVARRGRFSCALTGGSAASALYPCFRDLSVDWSGVHLFWGDERAVPPDDPGSNYRLAADAWLSASGVRAATVVRMEADRADLEGAAVSYGAALVQALGTPPRLDLVHLGMGPDGHVCSLFPDHPALDVEDRWVAAVSDSPKPPSRRLTLTLPTLAAAREIWFLVLGESKARIVARVLGDEDSSLPAARVARSGPRVRWLLDAAAGGEL